MARGSTDDHCGFMLPNGFHDLFNATAEVAGTLVGLLFAVAPTARAASPLVVDETWITPRAVLTVCGSLR